MELYRYAEVILRRWWLILLLLPVGVGSALYYSRGQTPIYQSTVTLALNPSVPSDIVPYASGPEQSTPPLERLAIAYNELLKSRSFGALAVSRLGVAAPPEALAGSISTRLTKDTNIFRIIVTWYHPLEAQRIANGVAELFISESFRLQQAKNPPADQDELERSLGYYRPRIEALRAQRDLVEGSDLEGLAKDDALEKIDSRLSSLENVYNNLLIQIQMLQSSGYSNLNTASIVDEAPPGFPINIIDRSQLLVFGAGSSLGLALALAFLMEFLDFSVKRPQDLVQLFGAGPLGVIGVIPGKRSRSDATGLDPRLVAAKDMMAPSSEAFRTLRTTLQFSSVDRPLRSLLVTSSMPGDGKSLVAANIAIAFAHTGQIVLLAGTDLRRPSLHRLFGLPGDEGFTSLVVSRDGRPDQPNSWAHPTAIPNLWVLPSGPLPPNPVELLSSRRADEVFQHLAKLFDLVIYDSPPVGPLADAFVLAQRADATIVVVRAGKTQRDMLRSVVAGLTGHGARFLGTVLNCAQPSLLGQHSYYYYGERSKVKTLEG